MINLYEQLNEEHKESFENEISCFFSGLSIDVDIDYHIDICDIEEDNYFDSIYEKIDSDGGFNCDIIYYSKAIDYLSENDPSLTESLSLAGELGYTPENLNSEVLASLLASQNIRTDFNDLEDEIDSFFENLFDKYSDIVDECND